MLALFLTAWTSPAFAAGRAERLRCEYRVNPLGVDVPAPRLSWIMVAANSNQRGVRQTAYRVLVASTAALLAENQRRPLGFGPRSIGPVQSTGVRWQTPAILPTGRLEGSNLG